MTAPPHAVNDTTARLGVRIAVALMCLGFLAHPAPAQANTLRTMPLSARIAALPSITAPASTNLGSAQPGGTVSAQLGSVTVTKDNTRSSWVTIVSATGFTTGGGTPAETISNSQVSYWSGPIVSRTGLGIYTPGQPTAAQAQSLNISRTAMTLTGGTNAGSGTWNPTLVVSVPASALAGTYTGTVTHSIA